MTSNGRPFCLGTIHGVWTKDGQATSTQIQAFERLLFDLKDYPELVLAGDFNAPRGRAAYGLIAKHLRDCLPVTIVATIDDDYHRAGHLPYVVDSIFARGYTVVNVRLTNGVSDHCALTDKVIAKN